MTLSLIFVWFLEFILNCKNIILTCLHIFEDMPNLMVIVPVVFKGQGYIPWHNTQSLAKGISGLNRMYESLSDNNSLKMFLGKHCLHLLKPLQGHTNIPAEYANPEVLDNLPDTIQLSSSFTKAQFNKLPGQVGVYVFFLEGVDKPTQCGSSIRFVNRMQTHYSDAAKGEFIFKEYPISSYKWVPVSYNNDYVSMYNLDNPMGPEEEVILTYFTQQEVRSVEQAYTTFANPTNYKSGQVSTWHNNWQQGDSTSHSILKSISWTTGTGKVYTRSSVEAAIHELGFSRKHISSVAKVEAALLDTAKYGKVTVTINGVDKSTTPTDKRYGTPINMSVDTTEFLPNHYYLFDQDMNMLPHGPYPTARAANLGMGLPSDYGGTHIWTNYMHAIYAVALGMSVYVVKRSVGQAMPVIVKCLNDGECKEYRSLNGALKVIAPGKTNDSHLLGLIVHNKPFSYKKEKSYLIEYKHAEHLASAVKRYNDLGITRSKPK